MLARVAVAARRVGAARVAAPLRSMSVARPEAGAIPGIEGLTGEARREAMVKSAFNEDLFDRDAIAFAEEGTRENPIPILSVESSRIVGISFPDDATIRWMNVKEGELVFDPSSCNFFALKRVSKEEVDDWVSRAEKTVLGSK